MTYILNHKTLPEGCSELVDGLDNLKKLYNGDNYIDSFQSNRHFKANGVSIEEWGTSIANCGLFVTDSFHGACFAIIFNRPFILFNASPQSGFERLKSLMEMLDIPDRTAYSTEDFIRLTKTPIDWKKVNRKLEEHLKISNDFIDEILEAHKNSPLVSDDKVRSYLETLEIKLEQTGEMQKARLEKENVKFLGISIYKKKYKNDCVWIYILGVKLLKRVKNGNKIRYKLFGKFTLLKKEISLR